MNCSDIVVIDHTCDRTHNNIQNRAIGGSEYQLYNLLYHLSLVKKSISCF